jgi:uncharacterized protein (TIGR03437 family)
VRAAFLSFFLVAGSLQARVFTPAPHSIVVFEPNRGQADAQAAFLARTTGYTLFLRPDGSAVVAAPGQSAAINFVGASRPRLIESQEPTGGVSSYFIGQDSEQWRTAIPHYGRVAYREVYPGIDVAWHATQGNTEFDFVVAAGGDASHIRFKMRAPGRVRVDGNGDLVAGAFRLGRPVAYQEGSRVAAAYRVADSGEISFRLGAYDHTKPLTIDPTIAYSTYVGEQTPSSIPLEVATGGAVDAAGNFYVCSVVSTSGFPTTPGAYDISFNGGSGDIALSRFATNGTSLVFSTYIGGGSGDYCDDVAIDGSGNPYIVGSTDSNNFPTTSGVVHSFPLGDTDAILAKFSAAGALLISTRIGGESYDDGKALAIDSTGNIYVGGSTLSEPQSAGRLVGVGFLGSYVVKLNSTATSRIYTRSLADCSILALALDSSGNVYVAGDGADAFQTTPGAFDRTHGINSANGSFYIQDGFVAKLNSSGSVVFATFLGGAKNDFVAGLAVDNTGNIYVVGITSSADFPVTAGALRTSPPAGTADVDPLDIFIAKLNPTGTALVYSTFFGGSSDDSAQKIHAMADGTVWIVGTTSSPNFPRTGDAFAKIPTQDNNDLFLMHLNATGTQMLYSSALGTTVSESTEVSAITPNGDIYIAALSSPTPAPAIPGVTATTIGTQPNIWAVKVSQAAAIPDLAVVSTASYATGVALSPGMIVIGFATGVASDTKLSAYPWESSLLGTSVRVKDSAGTERTAQLVYVFPDFLSFLIPVGSANGAATVDVVRNGSVVARGNITIGAVSPGLFTANSSGQGVASAIAIHVKPDNSQPYEDIFTCPAGAGSCVAKALDLGPANEKLILLIFGTGIRGRSSQNAVTATAGGKTLTVEYAGAQGTIDGLDQINLAIPRDIAKGLLTLQLTVDGIAANPVQFRIQ